MNKKRLGAVFLALLMCGLVSQASAQDAEPKFNSHGSNCPEARLSTRRESKLLTGTAVRKEPVMAESRFNSGFTSPSDLHASCSAEVTGSLPRAPGGPYAILMA